MWLASPKGLVAGTSERGKRKRKERKERMFGLLLIGLIDRGWESLTLS